MKEEHKDKLIFFLIGLIVGMAVTVVGGLKAYKILKGIRSGSSASKVSSQKTTDKTPSRKDFYLSFEDETDLKMLKPSGAAEAEISKEHATNGSKSLLVKIASGKGYPGLVWEVYGKHVQSWKGADNFHFDVYNNSEEYVDMEVKFKSGKDYPKKSFVKVIQLEPLKLNTFKIPIKDIARKCDITRMSYVKIFAKNPESDVVLYFDNVGTK